MIGILMTSPFIELSRTLLDAEPATFRNCECHNHKQNPRFSIFETSHSWIYVFEHDCHSHCTPLRNIILEPGLKASNGHLSRFPCQCVHNVLGGLEHGLALILESRDSVQELLMMAEIVTQLECSVPKNKNKSKEHNMVLHQREVPFHLLQSFLKMGTHHLWRWSLCIPIDLFLGLGCPYRYSHGGTSETSPCGVGAKILRCSNNSLPGALLLFLILRSSFNVSD